MQTNVSIAEGVYLIGVNDRRTALFENIWPIPYGVSYNSYLIRDDKCALLDTVEFGSEGAYLDRIEEILGERELDYLVVNHMEPDHSGEIGTVLKRYPSVKLIGNAMTRKILLGYTGDLGDRFMEVKDGDSLSLGKHTLHFYMTPWVHWPETMMTYESTEKILFSADAFGTFGATDGAMTDALTDLAEYREEMRRYYSNIVGKYGAQVQALLKKVSALEIKTICPLHGPMLTEGLEEYLRLYDLWSQWKPEEPESILIAQASIHGNTARASEILKDKLEGKGVRVTLCDLTVTDLSYAVTSAFYCGKLVLASSTYDGGLFPPMKAFLEHLQAKGFRSRRVGLMENGSWAPAAARLMRAELEKMKDLRLCETEVSLRGALNQTSETQMDALVAELCAE